MKALDSESPVWFRLREVAELVLGRGACWRSRPGRRWGGSGQFEGSQRGCAVPAFLPFVIVTAARDEAVLIETTIQSVVAQTAQPMRWVIVSDGSTDGTDAIVERYCAQHAWMELQRIDRREGRNFAGKAKAFNAGLASLAALPYEVAVCLDADVICVPGYFAYLLGKLSADPSLGLIGTPSLDPAREMYDYRYTSIEEVSGTCQMFRRACVEAIGGYVASPGGNIDTIACVMARMKGWKTQTFTQMILRHQRSMGTAERSPMQEQFNRRSRDYIVGNSALWELFRTGYQMTRKTRLVRGRAALALDFLWAALRRTQRPVSAEFIAFRCREQMERLRRAMLRRNSPRLEAC